MYQMHTHSNLKLKSNTVCVIKKEYLTEFFLLVFYQWHNNEL